MSETPSTQPNTEPEPKVALITGGASGIGRASAEKLAARGATVIIADVDPDRAAATANELGGQSVQLDVVSEDAWFTTVKDIIDEHGRLDVLVNAAGIAGDVVNGTMDRVSLEDFRRVMSVNVDGTFLGCREALTAMKKQGTGSIVNIASLGAYYPTLQHPGYGASKGAVTSLTKTVALYGASGGTRIRCNSVHPGQIETPLLAGIKDGYVERAKVTGQPKKQDSLDRIPLGGGVPDDVGRLVSFLATPDSSYITGAEITVDGGWRLIR